MTWINMPVLKNKRKQVLKFIALPVAILAVLFYAAWGIIGLYRQVQPKAAEPAELIKIDEPFSATVHFNDELGTDDFSKLIVGAIDGAKKSVELAMYSMDSTVIRDAIYRAADRGLDINLIFSDKRQATINNLFADKRSNIRTSFIAPSAEGYMHHKFLLLDRGTDNQKLFFGSSNFTYIQDRYDPSFILETTRPELVRIFGEEFDRLDAAANGRAESAIRHPFAARIEYPEGFLEIWFSPGTAEINIKDRMIALMRGAKDNIKAMIWYLTDKDMAAVLAEEAKTRPVDIITDDFNWSVAGSAFPILAAQKERQGLDNLNIITDRKRNQEMTQFLSNDSLNSFLHHHLLIVDDRIVVFGTENWSSSGFFRNNESMMLSDIKSLVDAFDASYRFNYEADK